MKPSRSTWEKRTGTVDMIPTLFPASGGTKPGMLGFF
jgi:hypothetical protein